MLFLGCSSTQSTSSPPNTTPATADAGDPSEDAGASADASTSTASCTVTGVPDAVKTSLSLDTKFYAKHVFVGPFSIVSSAKVPDETLCIAKDVVTHMLEERPELLDRLVEKKIRLAIMSETEVTTDVPEHATLEPKDYWDERARGLGATLDRPAVSAAEENVLLRDRSVQGREHPRARVFARDLQHRDRALRAGDEDAPAGGVDAAIAAGKYENTYAATNTDEYWAEGVQDWFDTNITVSPANGIHNEIGTRAQLKTYDPALATLVSEVFGDRPWRYACPSK